jgi:GPH family glycoside/pentoside/hexuronide:cation symporter
MPAVVLGWLLYFYAPPEDSGRTLLLGLGTFGALNFLGRSVDALSNPLVGWLSDRTRSRLGRRIPFVLFGTPPLALSFVALWFPPEPTSGFANAVWLGGWLAAFWFFFTLVVAPYLSMLPELTPNLAARIRISSLMAVFELAATVGVAFGVAAVIEHLPHGVTPGPLTDGYKVAGVAVGVVSLVSLLASVWRVREPPRATHHEVPFRFAEALTLSLRNPSFLPYVTCLSLMRIGLDVIVASMPYLVTVVMGSTETMAGVVQGLVVVLGALSFPLVGRLATRHGKRAVLRAGAYGFGMVLLAMGTIGSWPVLSPLTQGLLVLPLAAFPVATTMVLPRPMIADVIDADAARTGFRREAVYNGMEGLFTKFAAGAAFLLLTALLDHFGSSATAPWGIRLCGPVAGVLVLAAGWSLKRYPIVD